MTTRSKKVYAAVLVFALLALLIDRLLPGGAERGPAAAYAEPRAAPAATSASGTPLVVAAPFPRAAGLPTASDGAAVRDLFALTPKVYLALAGEEPPDSADGSGHARRGARPRVAEFKAAHRLSAVLRDGHLRVAILDGRWIRAGDKVEGCTLERIDGQSAYFSCADGTADISVARPRQ